MINDFFIGAILLTSIVNVKAHAADYGFDAPDWRDDAFEALNDLYRAVTEGVADLMTKQKDNGRPHLKVSDFPERTNDDTEPGKWPAAVNERVKRSDISTKTGEPVNATTEGMRQAAMEDSQHKRLRDIANNMGAENEPQLIKEHAENDDSELIEVGGTSSIGIYEGDTLPQLGTKQKQIVQRELSQTTYGLDEVYEHLKIKFCEDQGLPISERINVEVRFNTSSNSIVLQHVKTKYM